MAAKRPVRYTCTKPLDVYDDLGLFQRFCFFGRREVLEAIIDEVNDLQYLASTKGSVLLYFFRAFFCFCFLFLHFMVYSVEL